ncbi:MAG: tRNA (guanosine(46)-N7)-methyltransferase TrmB [Oscillospiraceae bacterium]|nr:tRNA (guanosine(46)-N7)-methyltransferase TrmB [Oscillospiraceae bacterium]
MRMRRKKHLDEKIAKCSNLILTPPITSDYREEVKNKEYIDFNEIFGSSKPLVMEIGCGKGKFICELAKREPDKNFIAVEVNPNVLCSACELAETEGVNNVIYIKCGAEVLTKYIKPHSIERIYLNFSCPFPKKAYENRRLTNIRFLEIYKEILSASGDIHQKTDNMGFFEYSLEQYSLAGFRLKNVSLDLHNSNFENNIVTEYEKKFSELGFRIYRLEAFPN